MLKERLAAAGIVSARAEAECLVAESLGTRRTELYLRDEPIPEQCLEAICGLLERRLDGEPLQYLLGSVEFYGHRLTVAPGVFIPRPETEALAERAIAYGQRLVRERKGAIRALDVGTGSGNLTVSLARAMASCVVVAVELSWEALRIVETNVDAQGVGDRVRLIQADWTSGVRGPFEIIVSNPPYVPTASLALLARHGRRDPYVSLDGGPDGMRFHHRLIAEAPRLLGPTGALGVECAEDQAQPLAEIFRGQPWASRVELFEDLAGRPRGVWVERQ